MILFAAKVVGKAAVMSRSIPLPCAPWLAIALAGMLAAVSGPAEAASSPWIEGNKFRARLVAGEVADASGAKRLMAGIELELERGWKTYWRMPGDTGVPPNFDFSASRKISTATVRYPAPVRLVDPAGQAVVYKDAVLFPVEIVAAGEGSDPLHLSVKLEIGVCEKICIPVFAKLDLDIPRKPGAAGEGALIAEAFARVPKRGKTLGPSDPRLLNADLKVDGDKTRLEFTAEFPGGVDGADLFVEGPGTTYVPMPSKVGDTTGKRVRFAVDLSKDEAAELKGKSLTVTLVAKSGASESVWVIAK